jgi:uncharacterized membrane protein YphA (DoxX/SURF4 family)
MLSLFPTLLSYQEFSPFLIRLTLGVILMYWGYKGLRDPAQSSTKKIGDVVEGLVGIALVIGLWTQLAALITGIGFIVCIVGKIRSRAFFSDGVNYIFILLVLAISLMITGPGWWAFDLAV